MADGKRSSDLYNKIWPAIYGVITLILLYVFIPIKTEIKEMRTEIKTEMKELRTDQQHQFQQFYNYYEGCKTEINNIRKETAEKISDIQTKLLAMFKAEK